MTFKEPEEADVCIEAINGRFFAGRQITAETWDGRTRYEVKETDEEREKRLKQWEDYLSGEGNSETNKGDTGEKAAKSNSDDRKTDSKPAARDTQEDSRKSGKEPDESGASGGPSSS